MKLLFHLRNVGIRQAISVLDRAAFKDRRKRKVDAINALNYALADGAHGKTVAQEGLRSVLGWRTLMRRQSPKGGCRDQGQTTKEQRDGRQREEGQGQGPEAEERQK